MGKHVSKHARGRAKRSGPPSGVGRAAARSKDAPANRTSERSSSASASATGRRNDGQPAGRRGAIGRGGAAADPASRYKAASRQRRHRLRNTLLVVGLVLVVGVVALASYVFAQFSLADRDITQAATKDPKIAKALTQAPRQPEKPFTILLLGVDQLGKAGDSRSDSILLARVDPKEKKIWILSIPRDTRAEIPGYGVRKINAAYQLGGPALTIKSVEKLTGVPVNHYMEIGFYGFRHIVEVLGGVWVNVDQYINDPKAARANPGGRGQIIKPGYQKLNADQALVYVRSRAFPDADFSRMRHQQEFFKALAKQASTPANLPRVPALMRNVARTVNSDMKVMLLVRYGMTLRGIPQANIQTTTLKGEWQSPYVVTDEAYAKTVIANMMAGRDFVPPKDPKAVVPANFTVVVRNGSGIDGLAATASGLVRAAGFKIGEVGNAKRQDYANTLIVYRGENAGVAKRVQQAIRRGKIIEDAAERYSFEGDVLVVVGRDWRSAEATKAASGR